MKYLFDDFVYNNYGDDGTYTSGADGGSDCSLIDLGYYDY